MHTCSAAVAYELDDKPELPFAKERHHRPHDSLPAADQEPIADLDTVIA